MANSVVFTNSGVISTYDTPGSYTWTKNNATQTITVIGWGGGGGGGSGRRGDGLTLMYGGNGGGNGGTMYYTVIPTSFFGATETVVVGAKGTGGTAVSVNDTNGNNGTSGTNSSVGSLTTSIGVAQTGVSTIYTVFTGATTNLGLGGTTASVASSDLSGGSHHLLTNAPITYGTDGAGLSWVPNGVTCTGGCITSTIIKKEAYNFIYGIDYDGGINGNFFTSTAAGCGGRIGVGSEDAGGNGASIKDTLLNVILAGGAGGLESGTINGGNGNAQVTSSGIMTGGTGGGGGGGQYTGGSAGTGGNGGYPGGGGGGGGASLNGTNSGAGGNGGDGLVIVIEYF